MNTQAIYDQLVTRLGTLTLPTLVQTENQRVTPEPGERYWRVTFSPSAPQAIDNVHNLLSGAFQVSFFHPEDGTTTGMTEDEDAILALFPRGLILSTPVHLEITSSYRIPRYQTGNYFQGGVIVLFRSYQPRVFV